jgi:hypothetical protein
MIKAMDMEILDWTQIDSWKGGKLAIMAGVLVYHSFFRWIPFFAVKKSSNDQNGLFISTLKASNMPWFFFANIFHSFLMLIFAFICWKLNKASWPLYFLLLIGAIEIVVYLVFGMTGKLFTLLMGKNSIILSNGFLTSIQLKEVKKIEKKYNDELYFTMSDGRVETINYRLLDKNDMTEFLIKLKNNAEIHNIYFGNDIMEKK